MSETLGYSTEYMQHLQGTTCRVWDDKEENTMNDEILQGKRWPHRMSAQFRDWAHDFVIQKLNNPADWRQ
jgi:hypothetical protein